MTAYLQRTNRIAVGRNSTIIEEHFPDPDPVPVPENPEYKKKVWVTNRTGAEEGYNVDCYIRMAVSYSNSDLGKAVTLENLNTRDWEYQEDGYYYYRGILKEGQSAPALFTGFSIDPELVEDRYQLFISSFSVSVYEESVQAEGFSNYQDAWTYYLNPLETV